MAIFMDGNRPGDFQEMTAAEAAVINEAEGTCFFLVDGATIDEAAQIWEETVAAAEAAAAAEREEGY